MELDPEDQERFQIARNGDNLVTPFQCDTCHFINIMNREPVMGIASDIRLLKCIRRANLDAFWSREPKTVNKVVQEAKRGLSIASSLGFAHTLFRPMGPFPVVDSMGMGVAVVMLQRSLDKGKHDRNIQFETVRKFRSAASNIYHASVEGQGAMVMAKDTQKLTVTECPTYSDFFGRFVQGMHKRMGDIVQPDRAISHDIMLELMSLVEEEWSRITSRNKLQVALEGAFYVIAFTLGLRGEEVPLIEIRGIRSHWEKGLDHPTPHVVIALLGRFKNEIGESYHLMPVLASTPGGLHPSRWVRRVLDQYEQKGIVHGYMFRNENGTKMKCKEVEKKFHERLETIQEKRPDLLGPEVDVVEEYGISRSFRRGATSEATNRGAPPDVVELNGQWRKSLKSGASRPNVTIREHYIDVCLTLNRLLEFSKHL